MNKYYGKEIGGVSRSERASGDLTGGSGGGKQLGPPGPDPAPQQHGDQGGKGHPDCEAEEGILERAVL